MLVHTDEGVTGISSGGDGLPDRELLERLLVGRDPLRTECIREIGETVDFHGGRPWAVEIAVWDLVGKVAGPAAVAAARRPFRESRRLRVERRAARAGRARRAVPRTAERGVKAVKLRFHHADWRDDVAVIAAVREAVGDRLEIMVDANQGWRMPGDRGERWDVATAAQCARALEELGICWLEEPLRTDDAAGYASLRGLTTLRIAAGEMVRNAGEARDLVVARPGRRAPVRRALRRVASAAPGAWPRSPICTAVRGRRTRGRTGSAWSRTSTPRSPFSTVPYIEVPHDPPAWSDERRDWLLSEPLRIAADGTIAPPPGPGARRRARSGRARALAYRLMQIAAVVLRSPGVPVDGRAGRARPAEGGRGARARRGGGRVPLRRPARGRRARRRPLADGARARGGGRRCRGRGRRRACRSRRPRRVLVRPGLRNVPRAARPGGRTSASPRAPQGSRARCSTGRAASRCPTAPRSSTA